MGRHIEVYDPALSIIWEGFVDEVHVDMGSLTARRGPLLAIANRVKVLYRTIRYDTNPPIGGEEAETAWADNEDSQAQYGILEELVTAGEKSHTQATEARNTYLAVRAWPETSQQISIRESGTLPSVRLMCKGYVHLLHRYYYAQVGNGSTQDLSAKIGDVLDADPNGLFSEANAAITENTVAVGRYEDGTRTAWEVITDCLSLGDTSDNRYLFGVYGGRRCVYAAVPTDVTYNHSLSDPGQDIRDSAGNFTAVWNVEAGKWLFISDFLTGQPTGGELARDPRNLFIESARYEAPWFAEFAGGKADKLSQRLDRLGLGSAF